MRQNRKTLGLVLIVFSVLLLQFNNCASGYQEGSESSNNDPFSSSLVPSLELNINNENNERFASPGIDIGGDCNPAGYEDVIIEWEMTNSNGVVINSNTQFTSAASCVNGTYSFRAQTHYPGGGPLAGQPTEDCTHRVSVRIFGRDPETNQVVEGGGATINVIFDNQSGDPNCAG